MAINLKAWKSVDGEVVYIQEGQTGEGILGANYTRIPGLDRVLANDLASSQDFATQGSQTTQDSAIALNTAKVSNATHTGAVTGSTALTITNNAVTNAKLADVPTNTIKGKNTAGTGDPLDLTPTQVTAMLNLFSGTVKGLVPPSGGGTANFLRANGTWAAPPGGGGGSNWNKTGTTLNPLVSGDGVRIGDLNPITSGFKLEVLGDVIEKSDFLQHRLCNTNAGQFSKAYLQFETAVNAGGSAADYRVLYSEKTSAGAVGGSDFSLRRQNPGSTEWLDYITMQENNEIIFNRTKTAGRTYGEVTFKNSNVNFDQQVKISGGSPGLGKILTSDASGLATWESLANKYRMLIWAEENGALGNNNDEWSFGNGATGSTIGLTQTRPGRILSLSINCETAGGGTTNVEARINNTSSGASITAGSNVNNAFNVLVTPIEFVAGDVLGFKTILAGSASDVRVMMEIEYDS